MAKIRAVGFISTGLEQKQSAGDTLLKNHRAVSISTAGAGIMSAAGIVAGIIDRTGPGAGYADTIDSATNILTAAGGLEVGCSFEFDFVNGVAFANTVAAGEGIILGSNVNVAASAFRRYLVTVTNNTPRQSYAVDTTNASASVTGFTAAQIDTLSVGMMVSGTGITAGTTISALARSTGTVTLSANATATNSDVLLVFSPVLTVRGLFSATA